MLRDVNPYVKDFLQIAEIPIEDHVDVQFAINPTARPRNEHPRIHNLNLHEVAVMWNESPGSTDLIVSRKSGGCSVVADIHRSFDPLHFVLLFPYGTDGWHHKIKQK